MDPPSVDDMAPPARRNRFEDAPGADTMSAPAPTGKGTQLWDTVDQPKPGDGTPRQLDGLTPGQTPGQTPRRNRWDRGATPTPVVAANKFLAPTPSLSGSKWDATPTMGTPAGGGETPVHGEWAATPAMPGGATPQRPTWETEEAFAPVAGEEEEDLTGLDARQQRIVREMRRRNRYLTDEDLNDLIPPGYEIVPAPAEFAEAQEQRRRDAEREKQDVEDRVDVPESVGDNLPAMRPEDAAFFELLLKYRHVANDADLPAEAAKEVMLLRCILRVKNGDSRQRKTGLRVVSDKAKYFGPELIFTKIFDLWMSGSLDDGEKHSIAKLADRAMFRLGKDVEPFIFQILTIVQPMLTDPDRYTRNEGEELIANLARAVGLRAMADALKNDFKDPGEDLRKLTSRTMAIVSKTLGVERLIENGYLKAFCTFAASPYVRQTSVCIVADLANMLGSGVRAHLHGLVAALRPCVSDNDLRVKTQAFRAVGSLATACYPHGVDEFLPILDPVRRECRGNRGRLFGPSLRAMGALIALMKPEDAMEYARATHVAVTRGFSTIDEEVRLVVINFVGKLAKHRGITREFLQEHLASPFFAAYWVGRSTLDRKTSKALVSATVQLSARIGGSTALRHLIDRLRDSDADRLHRLALETIVRVVQRAGTADLKQDIIERLVEGVMEVIQADELGQAISASACIVGLCKSLERRLAPFVMQIVGLVKSRMSSGNPSVRRQSAVMIGRLAESFVGCGFAPQVIELGRILIERLGGESDVDALSSTIVAIRNVLESLPDPGDMNPGPTELIQRLLPAMKNPSDAVQDGVISLVGCIAGFAEQQLFTDRERTLLAHKLFKLATDDLFHLLQSKKKKIRSATAETFGAIAQATAGPQIAKHLLNNLKKDDRTERICTEVALAIVAKRSKPYAVIPFLINEFQAAMGTELAEKIQMAVLKTLRFLFEYLGCDATDYMWCAVPLLEWALTDKSLQYRRMACEVIRHMAMSGVGENHEALMLHFLNLIHPNLLETTAGKEQLLLSSSVAEVFEAARFVVNPAYLLRMLEQGLWHPARKVRESYWRVYNTIYMGCGEALVPAYAPVRNEGRNTYERAYLEYVL